MDNKKKYLIIIVLFIFIGLMIFTFANPKDEYEELDGGDTRTTTKAVTDDKDDDSSTESNSNSNSNTSTGTALSVLGGVGDGVSSDANQSNEENTSSEESSNQGEASKPSEDEPSTIDDGLSEAERLVERAEASYASGDYTKAKDAVKNLSSSKDRTALESRLKEIEEGFNLEKLVDKLVNAVNDSESFENMESARTYNSTNEVTKKVENFNSNANFKKKLEDKLKDVTPLLNDTDAPRIYINETEVLDAITLRDGTITAIDENETYKDVYIKYSEDDYSTLEEEGRTLPNEHGEYTISVRDRAYNENTIVVNIDKKVEADEIKLYNENTSGTRQWAKLNDNIVFQIFFKEKLKTNPTVEIEGLTGTYTFTPNGTDSNGRYVYQRGIKLDTELPNGNIKFKIYGYKDLFDNEGETLTNNNIEEIKNSNFNHIYFDSTLPVIKFENTKVQNWAKVQSADVVVKEENLKEVYYVWSTDTKPAREGVFTNTDGVVKVEPSGMVCENGKCKFNVTESNLNGKYSLFVKAVDEAGNINYAKKGIYWFDKDAPILEDYNIQKHSTKENGEKALSTNQHYATLNDELMVTVGFNEEIKGTPTILINGHEASYGSFKFYKKSDVDGYYRYIFYNVKLSEDLKLQDLEKENLAKNPPQNTVIKLTIKDAKDVAGNNSDAYEIDGTDKDCSIVFDSVAPSIAKTAIGDVKNPGFKPSDLNLEKAEVVKDGKILKIYEGKDIGLDNRTGKYMITASLKDIEDFGSGEYTIIVYDKAGNKNEGTYIFDDTAPIVSGTAMKDGKSIDFTDGEIYQEVTLNIEDKFLASEEKLGKIHITYIDKSGTHNEVIMFGTAEKTNATKSFVEDGIYTVDIYDMYENKTTVTFVIDKTNPEISIKLLDHVAGTYTNNQKADTIITENNIKSVKYLWTNNRPNDLEGVLAEFEKKSAKVVDVTDKLTSENNTHKFSADSPENINGNYWFYVLVEDMAGNINYKISDCVAFDTVAPEVTMYRIQSLKTEQDYNNKFTNSNAASIYEDGIYYGNNLRAKVTDKHAVKVTMNDKDIELIYDYYVTTFKPDSDGIATLVATDAAGNETVIKAKGDSKYPRIYVNSDEYKTSNNSSKSYNTDAKLKIADDNVIDKKLISIEKDGNNIEITDEMFEKIKAGEYNLGDGTYNIKVTDKAYNVSTASFVINTNSEVNAIAVKDKNELKTALSTNESTKSEIYLTEDINLGKWSPVDVNATSGVTINGNGHTISNMTVEPHNSGSYEYNGFIANATGNMTIENLNFENVNIESTGKAYAGVVVGHSEAQLTINNVHVDGLKISNPHQAGGIVEYSSKDVEFNNCSVKNAIIGDVKDLLNSGTTGIFFGAGTANVNINNSYAENVDLYIDTSGYIWVGTLYSARYGYILTLNNKVVSEKNFDADTIKDLVNVRVYSSVNGNEIDYHSYVKSSLKVSETEPKKEEIVKKYKAPVLGSPKDNETSEEEPKEEEENNIDTSVANFRVGISPEKFPLSDTPSSVEEEDELITSDTITAYSKDDKDFVKYLNEHKTVNKSSVIWWAEFSCDTTMCEGFKDSSDKIIEGRRGDIESITMTAPAPLKGYKFVGWKKYTRVYNQITIQGFEAVYEKETPTEEVLEETTETIEEITE